MSSHLDSIENSINGLGQDIANSIYTVSINKAVSQEKAQIAYKAILEALNTETKLKVIPAAARPNHVTRQSVKRSTQSKHKWIPMDNGYEYTTDFSINSGWPVKYANTVYISHLYTKDGVIPITKHDTPLITVNGYKPFMT